MQRAIMCLFIALLLSVIGTADLALAQVCADIEAGPLWNQSDAQNKCPQTCQQYGSWNGQWRTTVQGSMSICQCCFDKSAKAAIESGPLWNQSDAQNKCPQTCQQYGSWTGQWWTTVQGRMSVCECHVQVAQAQPTAGPQRRPNFVTIHFDDMGFSDLGLFGGEIPTPNIDQLGKEGIVLTNYYGGSACAVSRAMFYTGKDYHKVGWGNLPGWNQRPEQKGRPGYEGYLVKSALPFPELMQKNSYHTMMTGKWDMGGEGGESGRDPHDRGFTETRALLLPSGDTHFSEKDGTMISTRHKPLTILYSENGQKLERFPREFYSTTYYTDMAIEMLNNRDKSKPFYLNVTYIAPHTPWQAPAEVTAKYIARYAKGWDALRQERFKRQQELGLFPKEAQLPPRPADVPAWDSLSADDRKIEAKKMAIYAAMIEVLDQNVGRLVNHLKQIGEYENTVIFLDSDNGAAYGIEAKAIPLRWKYISEHFDNSYDNLGNRNSYEGGHIGWALLSNTPLNNYKGDLYEGGVRLPALVHYPRSTVSGVRTNRILSIMDIAPTILEMAGIAYPNTYNGQPNPPMDGVSMADLFNGNVAYNPDRGLAWELNGAKGVRKGDWKISQRWLEATQCWGDPPAGDPPGLFNLATDPFERIDLAKKEPQKYKELLDLYDRFAKENNVIEVSACMAH
jgi:arylsulfatase A-like enzyme